VTSCVIIPELAGLIEAAEARGRVQVIISC
jgi:hypothetical protein